MTGGARVGLWPIWGVALGLGYPLAFLYALDGLAKYQRWPELLFTFAAGWTFHALLTLLVCAGPWVVLRVAAALAPQWMQERLQAVVVVIARFCAICATAFLAYLWLETIWPGVAARMSRERWGIALAALATSVAVTWRRPAAGALLHLGRRIAIAGGVVAALLVPTDAVLNWIASQPGPRTAAAAPARPADVVLITVDTLSARRMSLYGHATATTPRLEAFSRSALVFDRYYANSNFTTPTIASILFSHRPWTHRALQLGARPLATEPGASLLGRFREAGYRVMTVDTNPYASPGMMGLSSVVDRAAWFQMRTAYFSPQGFIGRWLPSFQHIAMFNAVTATIFLAEYYRTRGAGADTNDHFDPAAALDDARRMWSEETDQPRFLWVHLMAPHSPYAAPAPYLGMFDASPAHRVRFNSGPPPQFRASLRADFPAGYAGRYDESIRMVDDRVGEILDWLDAQPGAERRAIVFSADHGESFSRGYGDHCGPLLTEDLIRIPLIIRGAGATASGRDPTLAEQIDLAPTLAQLAGIPPAGSWEGRALTGAAPPVPEPAIYVMNFERNARFEALKTGSIAMLQGEWKYVHYLNVQTYPNMPPLLDELYDLRADPGEQVNRLTEEPQRSASMKAAILEQLQIHAGAVR